MVCKAGDGALWFPGPVAQRPYDMNVAVNFKCLDVFMYYYYCCFHLTGMVEKPLHDTFFPLEGKKGHSVSF